MKRTNKKWLALQIDSEEEPPSTKANFKVPHQANKVKKCVDFPPTKTRSFDFDAQIRPKTVSDLAIHRKKVSEVESWLQTNVCSKPNGHSTSILLVTGPTGSGKSTTLKVLCRELDISVSEWENPLDLDYEVFKGPNQITKFTEFLTESKWASLFSSNDKKIVLVEELPNAVLKNPELFGDILEETTYKGNIVVVFVCTDSTDGKMSLIEKLFTPDIRNKYKIKEICFNACASTLLKSALKRAQDLIQANLDIFKNPSSEVVNSIIASSMGDLKCAMNQYYFASLLGAPDLPIVPEKLPEKSNLKRKRSATSGSIKAMIKDETLGLFHGIGRVLNPKIVETDGVTKIQCDFDKLIDEFSPQPATFVNFLFENYLKYFGDVFDARQAIEIVSFSQIFLDKLVDRSDIFNYALWISSLGVMLNNKHKVSKWNQITGPRKIQKKVKGDVSPMDLCYYNRIIRDNK